MKKTTKSDSIQLPKEIILEIDRYPTRIKFILFLIVLFEIVGAVFYHNIEGWSWINSFYFTTVTLTTVGYGDLTPQTDFGRLFTIGYVIMGVSIVFYGLSTVAAHFIEQREEEFIKAMGGISVRKPARGILDNLKKFYSAINDKNDQTKKRRNHRSK